MMKFINDRLWPVPDRPWSIEMNWHDLAFIHWPVSKDVLRPLLPSSLELDTYSGDCWIGIVPFYMTGVRHRLAPAFSWYSDFLELNVRTYVRSEGKPGVWFFSLDAESLLAVKTARRFFQLPYFHAEMDLKRENKTVHYSSRRKVSDSESAEFLGSYYPTGGEFVAGSHTIERWLTERYCLYTVNKKNKVMRADINHNPWVLQQAEVEIRRNTMLNPLNIEPLTERPLVHFSKHLNVISWSPELVTG